MPKQVFGGKQAYAVGYAVLRPGTQHNFDTVKQSARRCWTAPTPPEGARE